ncbi:sodium-dependent phosphate transport protein 2B-like [Ptychodera flava]|uniref:sodium-dependent phosphate transport protein 2B-like n=1 Tax=Ptychodera flava TaxID=63121 RepID=UPI00396A25D4
MAVTADFPDPEDQLPVTLVGFNTKQELGKVDSDGTQPDELSENEGDEEEQEKKEEEDQKLTTCGKVKRVLIEWIGKLFLVFVFLYFFIVALNVMGDAFTLIGGSAASAALSDSSILENPITGLMMGMLITVILQSSSASTSIIVSMVASNILQVQEAIPMIMGANLGTSITNTIVSGGQANDREAFRLSFAGATVHDCFNWLAVAILLPLECATGYLYHVTDAIVDRDALERVALGLTEPGEESLVKRWCETEDVFYMANQTTYEVINGTNYTIVEETEVYNYTVYIERCNHLFAYSELSDEIIGLILLVFSLVLLMLCLFGLVKTLQSMIRGSAAAITVKILNANFPGRLSWLTGYVAILIGMVLTIAVQSSSVFTSMITPLVGMRVITVKRMYPLTLGANLGTTCTGLLAAFASSESVDFVEGVQIALCHLFFNITGILCWYPIPATRKPPIAGAKYFGTTAAEYRWFSLLYILTVFIILPLIILGLSFAGSQWVYLFSVIIVFIIVVVGVMNLIQAKFPRCLPKKLRNWEFLPKWMRSLEPYDQLIVASRSACGKCTAKCKCCNSCRHEKDDQPYTDHKPIEDECTKDNDTDINMVVVVNGNAKESDTKYMLNNNSFAYENMSFSAENEK